MGVLAEGHMFNEQKTINLVATRKTCRAGAKVIFERIRNFM